MRAPPALLPLAILLALPPPLGAQGSPEEALVTDRPDFTESAVTVGGGRVQAEAGATLTDLSRGDEELTLGELLVRAGLGDAVELRLGIGSVARLESAGLAERGLVDPSLGVKLRLPAQLAAAIPGNPDLAALVAASLPVGEEPFREPHAQPEVKVAAGWQLRPRLSLGANVGWGYRSEEGRQFGEGLASLALGVELAERLGAYGEVYGLWPAGGEGGEFADAGVTWLVTPDLQLDARLGWELGGGESFVGAGLARRW